MGAGPPGRGPTHVAVALQYQPGKMDAPGVLAKSYDEVAQKIKAIAAEHNIPMVENIALARALARETQIGQAIKPKWFKPVAEILEAHHIFDYASWSRELPEGTGTFGDWVEKDLKIDLWGPENGVLLPRCGEFRTGSLINASIHRGRTSGAYSDAFISELQLIRSREGGRDEVLQLLEHYRSGLLDGSIKINAAKATRWATTPSFD